MLLFFNKKKKSNSINTTVTAGIRSPNGGMLITIKAIINSPNTDRRPITELILSGK